jgi:hypothetical protein
VASKKSKSLIAGINIDSLMDIMTCLFGIILFAIVIAVINARGVNVKMYMPMAASPPEKSIRKICICANGTVRVLDVSAALLKLGVNQAEITYESLPWYVAYANSKNISDDYFRYKLDYVESADSTGRIRGLSFIVEERPGVKGDTVNDLEQLHSKFDGALKTFDNKKHWVAFAVDKASVAVFKKAREHCIQKGFMTGWDPAIIQFPYKEPLFDADTASGDVLPSPDLSKINTN